MLLYKVGIIYSSACDRIVCLKRLFCPQQTNLNHTLFLVCVFQMPRGVPVATVAINNATNAGLLAVRLLGISDIELQARSGYLVSP